MKIYKFSADWCMPCKALAVLMDSIDTNSLDITSVDIDSESAIDLVSTYGIRSVPTLVKVKVDGTFESISGSGKTKAQIEDFLFN